MIAPGVPGKLVDDAVVLMKIVACVGENQVGREAVFQVFKEFLDLHTFIGKETVAKIQNGHVASRGAFQKEGGTTASFSFAIEAGAEDDPVEFQIAARAEKLKDGAAAADFDVVGMSAEAEDLKALATIFFKSESEHWWSLSGHWPKPAKGRCLWRKDHRDAACP